VSLARRERYWEGVEDADRPADGSASRPSKNNRQGPAGGGEPPDSHTRPGHGHSGPDEIPDETARRPISVEPDRALRAEAVFEQVEEPRSRPWHAVVSEWRDWYEGYRGAHIEFESPEGETVRTALENSYMPEYGKRYYAKLKDLERGIERTFQNLTTVMLTFSASNQNASGGFRCPGDHMRDIADGWDVARKQLYQVLDGLRWEYAKVWEPHESGYGHMHVAVFVEAPDLAGQVFEPVLRSYVENTKPAGSDAHSVENAVSVNNDVENLGSYISEYIGIFGDETLNRPIKEQMFYAVTWATNTRRVEFSNGAQEIQSRERFRRETGLRPEDRGGDAVDRWKSQSDSEPAHGVESVEIDPEAQEVRRTGESDTWDARSICRVEDAEPEYHDVGAGGVDMVSIAGSSTADPPPRRE